MFKRKISLFVVVIFLLAVCFVATVKATSLYSCSDSDGGKISNITGTIVTNDPNSSGNISDKCLIQLTGNTYKQVAANNTCSPSQGACYVEEVYCDSSRSYGYNYEYISCPNGCLNGACIITAVVSDGDLIKVDGVSTIYRLNSGKRDVVPYIAGYEDYKNAVMGSWGWSESNVKIGPQAVIESYPLGKNITVKAGSNYILKKQNEEKYYIVVSDAKLSEVNKSNYNNYIQVVIPDGFLPNYAISESLYEPDFFIKDIYYDGGQIVYTYCNQGASLNPTKGLYIKITANGVTKQSESDMGTVVFFQAPEQNQCFNDNSNMASKFGIVQGQSYPVSVTVDYNNAISEYNENNNTLTKTVTIAETNITKPDLVIADLKIDRMASWDPETLKYVWVSFKNLGGAVAGRKVVKVKVTDSPANEVYYMEVETDLKGGDSNTLSVNMPIKNLYSAHNLKAEIDPDNTINESNENNNTFTKTIIVGGNGETIIFSNIQVPTSLIRPRHVTITWDTNFPSNSDVHYWAVDKSQENWNWDKIDNYNQTHHEIILKDLKPFTTYNFTVSGQRKAGEVKTTSGEMSFTTTIEEKPTIKTPNDNEPSPTVLQLQRKITELEKQVIELEKKLTLLDNKFADKYSGTMFLDVENKGRLWYVDPASKNRFYFENGQSALSIGSKLATGISYKDIQKIPVGVPDKLYNLKDNDNDGLPDRLESALGSDPNKADTDGDGISDKQELIDGYNPTNNQKFNYNSDLINRLEGKMLLQVAGPNSHGEIWYIHKGQRWYGGTEDSMYEIMKARSLGATPENIRKIEVGGVAGTE